MIPERETKYTLFQGYDTKIMTFAKVRQEKVLSMIG